LPLKDFVSTVVGTTGTSNILATFESATARYPLIELPRAELKLLVDFVGRSKVRFSYMPRSETVRARTRFVAHRTLALLLPARYLGSSCVSQVHSVLPAIDTDLLMTVILLINACLQTPTRFFSAGDFRMCLAVCLH
jgi:hypothetical protein